MNYLCIHAIKNPNSRFSQSSKKYLILDELGRVSKQVQEAIDLAWMHLGQVSALEKEVAILESKQIRDTDGLYQHAKKLIPFFKIRERTFFQL